jgi:hypothetical protein
MDSGILAQFPYFNLVIPAWQMGLYLAVISICMLSSSYRLSLLVTYVFTLYWGFFLYWGEILRNIGTFPVEATWFLLLGLLHVALTLTAFFKET